MQFFKKILFVVLFLGAIQPGRGQAMDMAVNVAEVAISSGAIKYLPAVFLGGWVAYEKVRQNLWNKQIAALDGKVEKLNAKVSDGFARLESKIDSNGQKITRLTKSNNRHFNLIDKRLLKVSQRIYQAAARADIRFDKIDAELSEVRDEIRHNTSCVKQLVQENIKLNKKVDQLTEQINRQGVMLQAVLAKLDQSNAQVHRNGASLNMFERKFLIPDNNFQLQMSQSASSALFNPSGGLNSVKWQKKPKELVSGQ